MPANLPPQYFEAEKRYRAAKTPEAKVEALEEMLVIMPKHKGTDRLRGDLRQRISKYKVQAQQRKKTGSRRDPACTVVKEGAVQVVLLGPPNTGKSSLVAALTNARPEVADFPHTTRKASPGMVLYENVQFQLVDTPPVTREYLEPWMGDLIRRADLLAIVLDLQQDPLGGLEDTLAILADLRVFPEGAGAPPELDKVPVIKKTLILVNKVDGPAEIEDYGIFHELYETEIPCLDLSTSTGRHLKEFVNRIYDLSGIIRVYTRAPGKEVDRAQPFVLPRGSTLEELAGRIHKDFVKSLKFARIWGSEVFDGQMVQRDHVLGDGDVVEIHA